MRKCIDSGSDPFLAILDHRNTTSQGLLSSPAQRLMSRRTKTLLPTVTALLRPQVVDAQHTSRDIKRGQNRQAVYYNRGASDKQALEEGDSPTTAIQIGPQGLVERYRHQTTRRTLVCHRHAQRCRET